MCGLISPSPYLVFQLQFQCLLAAERGPLSSGLAVTATAAANCKGGGGGDDDDDITV